MALETAFNRSVYKKDNFSNAKAMANSGKGLCRWCGDGSLEPRLVLKGPQGFDDFSLASCNNCGCWQVNPPLSDAFIKNYFSDDARWLKSQDPDGRPVDPFQRMESRRREYEKYASAMLPYIKEGGQVLDIGAGGGLMLSLLPEHLKKIALEPNHTAAQLAKEKGLDVICSWAEELDFPLNSITALIMNQSLDHLRDPGYFLAKAVHWIKPGGLILISGLINPNSWCARVFGPKYRLWHPLYQVYPTPYAAVNILRGWGFEILDWWNPYFGTPYGSMLKLIHDLPVMLLASCGLNKNHLSPAWPGNTFSLLARKNLLYRHLEEASPIKWFDPALNVNKGKVPVNFDNSEKRVMDK